MLAEEPGLTLSLWSNAVPQVTICHIQYCYAQERAIGLVVFSLFRFYIFRTEKRQSIHED